MDDAQRARVARERQIHPVATPFHISFRHAHGFTCEADIQKKRGAPAPLYSHQCFSLSLSHQNATLSRGDADCLSSNRSCVPGVRRRSLRYGHCLYAAAEWVAVAA